MSAGRPRLPDELKKAKGTFKPSRSNPEALQLTTLQEIPEPPATFDEVATNVWNTICGELIKHNIMQSIDIFQLQMLCNEMSIYWNCQEQLKTQNYLVDTGTGSTKVNPLITISTQALSNVNKIAAKFGLTPADRQKLKMTVDAGKPKTNAALDLISRKKMLTAGKKD